MKWRRQADLVMLSVLPNGVRVRAGMSMKGKKAPAKAKQGALRSG
jgi:hypothetical protein